jgi:hypothetical protein
MHQDHKPSLQISLDLTNGKVFARCQVCYPPDRVAGKVWWADFKRKIGVDALDLAEQRPWVPVAVNRDGVPQGIPAAQRELDARLHDRVYGYISRTTELTEWHREHLEGRGMSAADARRRGYFSVEEVWHPEDPGRLDSKQFVMPGMPVSVLRDVPGFSMRKNKKGAEQRYLHFRPAKEGIFCPARDVQGRLVGGQIRQLDPDEHEKGRKYKWLPGGGSHAHVPLDCKPGKVIWVTEGIIKADLATARGFPCISTPGVAAWRKAGVLEVLRHVKPERVVIAFDKDQWEGGHPKEQLRRLAKALQLEGYHVSVATWDSECKGIDDLLWEGGNPHISDYDFEQWSDERPEELRPLDWWAEVRDEIGRAVDAGVTEVYELRPRYRVLYTLFGTGDGSDPVYRSIRDIAKEAELSVGKVHGLLADMKAEGRLAVGVNLKGQITYYLPEVATPLAG